MLVLRRKMGESITIRNMKTDEQIVVKYCYSKPGRLCGIGIDAPAHYQIHRTEKLEEMLRPLPETPTEYETSVEDYGVNHAG